MSISRLAEDATVITYPDGAVAGDSVVTHVAEHDGRTAVFLESTPFHARPIARGTALVVDVLAEADAHAAGERDLGGGERRNERGRVPMRFFGLQLGAPTEMN